LNELDILPARIAAHSWHWFYQKFVVFWKSKCNRLERGEKVSQGRKNLRRLSNI